jgi:transposase
MLATVQRQIAEVEARMQECLEATPDGRALLSIPKLGAPTAAVFLGSIGDPRAYQSSRQALRLAGLSLITSTASGMKLGQPRLSKRGRSELRRLMYMFAVRSVTKNGIFRAERDRALKANPKTPKKKVLIAVARKALRLMFNIAYERRLYTKEPPR